VKFVEREMDKYTKEDVVRSLQAFAQKVGEKNLTKRKHQQLKIKPSYPTVLKLFGSWEKALAKAGFSPIPLVKYTDDDLIKSLQKCAEQNDGHISQDIYKKDCPSPSAHTIIERFGSWENALEKAGLRTNTYRNEPYTKEEMITALQRFYQENGGYISNTTYYASGRTPSPSAIRNTFGSWNQALIEAGIPINVKQKLRFTKKQMIVSLKRVAEQVPTVLSRKLYQSLKQKDDPSSSSIERYFGTWNQALQEAGLPTMKKKYTKEEIKESIQLFFKHYQEEASLDLYEKVGWLPGSTTILRHYTSWEEAVQDAGHDTKYHHYTKEWATIQIKEAFLKHGGKLTADDYAKFGYKPSLYWIKMHFGSWKEAKKQIGIE